MIGWFQPRLNIQVAAAARYSCAAQPLGQFEFARNPAEPQSRAPFLLHFDNLHQDLRATRVIEIHRTRSPTPTNDFQLVLGLGKQPGHIQWHSILALRATRRCGRPNLEEGAPMAWCHRVSLLWSCVSGPPCISTSQITTNQRSSTSRRGRH